MKTILFMVVLLSVGCSYHENNVSEPHVPDRTESPHFFKDILRVDSTHDPDTMYRMENDEVTCYGRGSGLSCHWKVQP